MAVAWDDFRVLLALSRGGSVAAAARELQVDNSTVSRRLASLEEAIGAQLLIRGGREFSWTAEGRTAVDAAAVMEQAVVQATRLVHDAKQVLSGTVRVSVPPGMVPRFVQHVLPGLREAHPALEVEFVGSFGRADLARGEADLALRMARPGEPSMVARRAFEMGWFVYAAHEYLERAGSPATLDELRRHRLVLFLPSMHHLPPLAWLEQHRVPGQPVTRAESIDLAARLTSAGAGLAVLPTIVADGIAEIRRVFPDRVACNTGWIVYHESLRDSARVRAVADALAAYLAQVEPVLAGLSAPESS